MPNAPRTKGVYRVAGRTDRATRYMAMTFSGYTSARTLWMLQNT